ncbi:MAG TPA: hypothetical protein VGK19_11560 [Capsulimonadaceae bacterium]|jgi:hypothetical protein
MTQPIGEIIEVSTTSFVAQCLDKPRATEPRLSDPPPFGSFVKIQPRRPEPDATDEEFGGRASEESDPFVWRIASSDPLLAPNVTFALVCNARTTSLAPGRRPVALGMDDEDEIRLRQPQIFELLTTEFSGLLVGYTMADGRVRRHLPPVPPRIHSQVTTCEAAEVRSLTRDLSFLRSVLAGGGGVPCDASPEDLVAACLRAGWAAWDGQDDDFLVQAGRKLLELLGDDYQRLQAIMNAVIY